MGVSGKRDDRHDHYFKKARTEHYRARSIYKLKEIQERFHLIRRGGTVVDLGAYPGSWTQYAAELVGPQGKVIAVDRTRMEGGLPSQVTCFQRDMLELSPQQLRDEAQVTRVDVVVSDMAPNTSGVRSVDHARSLELCRKALAVAQLLLPQGGHFVCKIFQGEDVAAFLDEVKEGFEQARLFKPDSSRDESVETFVVAQRFKGTTPAPRGEDVRPRWDPLLDG